MPTVTDRTLKLVDSLADDLRLRIISCRAESHRPQSSLKFYILGIRLNWFKWQIIMDVLGLSVQIPVQFWDEWSPKVLEAAKRYEDRTNRKVQIHRVRKLSPSWRQGGYDTPQSYP